MAFSGIAALLLPSNYTTHSHFQIPIHLHKKSTCNIFKSLNLAEFLWYTSLFIWDKVLMQYHYCFKAVHYIFIDGRFNDSTFGGLPTILGSNCAQIPLIVLWKNCAAIVGACLQQLFL